MPPEYSTGFDMQTLEDFAEYAIANGGSKSILFAVRSYVQHRQAIELQETIENVMEILPPEGTRSINPAQTLEDIRLLITGE